jgi:hypothetical protein
VGKIIKNWEGKEGERMGWGREKLCLTCEYNSIFYSHKTAASRPEDVASAALKGMENDEFEIPVGFARGLCQAAWSEPEKMFERMNR